MGVLTTKPSGIGVYIRHIRKNRHGSPEQAAKQAKSHGVNFVAIMACWQDRQNRKDRHVVANKAQLPIYAEAFTQAGIDVWIWGFPRAERESSFVERMEEASVAGVRGWILDPEKYYRWTNGRQRDKRIESAERLIQLTNIAQGGSLGLGVTSYGAPHFHKRFPWEVFGGEGWGSPQYYRASSKVVQKGLGKWHGLGWTHIVPSVPAFGKNSGSKLDAYLQSMMKGSVPIKGFIFWSWMQTNAREWNVLKKWSKEFVF